MKKLILIFLISIFTTSSYAKSIDEAYFAGGCFSPRVGHKWLIHEVMNDLLDFFNRCLIRSG